MWKSTEPPGVIVNVCSPSLTSCGTFHRDDQGVHWSTTADIEEFIAAAAAFLLSHPVDAARC